MECEQILDKLISLSSKENLEGMSRYGINTNNALGISIPQIRSLAKEIGKNHILALDLWNTKFHETKILASMIGISKMLTSDQMENWVKDFDSWDVCDQTCNNLFGKSPLAYDKSFEWCKRNEEFVKRAGYVLMAVLAVHDKKRKDEDFFRFFPLIYEGSTDDRIYVKKAVNWALRQIGKRNNILNKKAIEVAIDIKKIDSRTAKWIANDALRELQDIKIIQRIKNK
ncbi:MAG: DNA alkylation repair enzyme [Candidatus Methanofastidiosum methylothiophilum]|jgi:3-methyladenine DNA glycosylase AlkD|uniref:DNA alkylation repair enzyme n=1 Tax=Candidatus Methanofastidiosum methylothiophilum TaxID=1705564 RepID=A0A150JMX2_9EURY|nr:MAG: DNA alkylation repair enzyme [Candidatus Methanofastidiosum methylthiophilus]MBP6931991.1 DNA alkylation repair protein [Methanofastidiosum sp.]OQC52808.1 MAG: DNA alkylation repair enzyme [Euryarchaeota archaeon ADurb.Bin023]KYC57669.1 MAG: DNA alkylation repair enzyme [Candidatus Methanofastidiosum methylthiophilus]KYC58441.1 MAG: DNA alkylation repair enzyme [Candidatus Methanofastidiosum methylthiophilus]